MSANWERSYAPQTLPKGERGKLAGVGFAKGANPALRWEHDRPALGGEVLVGQPG